MMSGTDSSNVFGGYFIYALIDPRDDLVRHGGVIDNLFNRLLTHLEEAGSRTRRACGLQICTALIYSLQSGYLKR